MIYQASCLLNNIIKVYCRSNITARDRAGAEAGAGADFDIVTLVRLAR